MAIVKDTGISAFIRQLNAHGHPRSEASVRSWDGWLRPDRTELGVRVYGPVHLERALARLQRMQRRTGC
jgi:hypothetical protein